MMESILYGPYDMDHAAYDIKGIRLPYFDASGWTKFHQRDSSNSIRLYRLGR